MLIAFAETVLSAQAVQMHSPKIAQLHKLCMLIADIPKISSCAVAARLEPEK